MKQNLSVAGLAVRLTVLPVICLFAVTGAVQWSLCRPTGFESFETAVSGSAASFGWLGWPTLMTVLCLVFGTRHESSSEITLNRLGIPPFAREMCFAAVMAGWFFLYRVFQTAMMGLLWLRFTAGSEREVMGWLLACYRSEYLHVLVPLRDSWGYVRNILMTASFGLVCAAASERMRRTGGAFWNLLAAIVWVQLFRIFTGDQPAARTADICLSLAALIVCIGCIVYEARRDPLEET